jgi:hypothetical protein
MLSEPRDVAAGSREACDEPGTDRIGDLRDHDWHSTGDL